MSIKETLNISWSLLAYGLNLLHNQFRSLSVLKSILCFLRISSTKMIFWDHSHATQTQIHAATFATLFKRTYIFSGALSPSCAVSIKKTTNKSADCFLTERSNSCELVLIFMARCSQALKPSGPPAATSSTAAGKIKDPKPGHWFSTLIAFCNLIGCCPARTV